MSFLQQISVLILTFNEASNIARTLDSLTDFSEIVVLDSGSTDETLAIACKYPNVRICSRAFDDHSNQWNYGLTRCGLRSEWIFSLDADYCLPKSLIDEISALMPGEDVAGYQTRFTYWVLGKPLSSSLYPPVVTLVRRLRTTYIQDGHTQRAKVDGQVLCLVGRIAHDDRKSLGHWLLAQYRYAELECELLLSKPWSALSWRDRLRRMGLVTPWLVPAYSLTVSRGFLDGWPGIYYALQRSIAEAILSLFIIKNVIKK